MIHSPPPRREPSEPRMVQHPMHREKARAAAAAVGKGPLPTPCSTTNTPCTVRIGRPWQLRTNARSSSTSSMVPPSHPLRCRALEHRPRKPDGALWRNTPCTHEKARPAAAAVGKGKLPTPCSTTNTPCTVRIGRPWQLHTNARSSSTSPMVPPSHPLRCRAPGTPDDAHIGVTPHTP